MATGGASPPTSTAPGDQDFQELGEKDLKALFQALLPMAAQYKFFGIEIDVHNSEIQKIRSQFTNPNDCLFEILSIRLKMSPPLTWNDIDTALRSDAVGESRLANKIKKKYGHLYRPDPSLQAATSDQEGGRKISEKRKRNRKPKSARRNRLQHDSSTTGSDTMAGKDSNQAKEFSEVSGTCDRQDTSDQQHKILSKPMVPKEVHAERERHPTSDGRMGSSSYHTGRSDKSKPLRRREWKNKLKGGNKQGQDSSSEINVPLQGNEKHQIIVFERFFGQLCCEISKPVQVAAQLQRKGLISKSTMKDMIISPESQQSKTISLVDAVDKTIKSKPDCLFAFIEVLLENEALQTLGREMLREAGKHSLHFSFVAQFKLMFL